MEALIVGAQANRYVSDLNNTLELVGHNSHALSRSASGRQSDFRELCNRSATRRANPQWRKRIPTAGAERCAVAEIVCPFRIMPTSFPRSASAGNAGSRVGIESPRVRKLSW